MIATISNELTVCQQWTSKALTLTSFTWERCPVWVREGKAWGRSQICPAPAQVLPTTGLTWKSHPLVFLRTSPAYSHHWHVNPVLPPNESVSIYNGNIILFGRMCHHIVLREIKKCRYAFQRVISLPPSLSSPSLPRLSLSLSVYLSLAHTSTYTHAHLVLILMPSLHTE